MDNAPGPAGVPADGNRIKTSLEQGLAIALLVLLVIGSFIVVRPFLTALCWAAVLCFCLWPMQRRLVVALKGSRTLAALITTLTVTLTLVAPFVIIGFSIADDARNLAEATQKWIEGGPPPPPKWFDRIPIVGPRAKGYWQEFVGEAFDFAQKLKRATNEEPGPSPPMQIESTKPSRADAIDAGEEKVARTLKAVFARTRSWFVVAGLAIGKGIVEVAL